MGSGLHRAQLTESFVFGMQRLAHRFQFALQATSLDPSDQWHSSPTQNGSFLERKMVPSACGILNWVKRSARCESMCAPLKRSLHPRRAGVLFLVQKTAVFAYG